MSDETTLCVSIVLIVAVAACLLGLEYHVKSYNVHAMVQQEIEKGTDPQKAACAHFQDAYNCEHYGARDKQ